MLRILQSGNSLPFSFVVDRNAAFMPGMVAQLNVMGNQVVCGVSDGTAPLGIIDDIKTNAFTSAAIDEVIIVPATGVISNNQLVTPIDIKTELANPNVIARSFTSNPVDVALIPRNGVIIFPAGTPLNFDMAGTGTPDSIRTVVNYTYQVPNVPGDDSTFASGRVTVWFQRIIAATDQFETNQRYPINANLFVSESGLFTTRQVSPNHAAIAMVTGSPTSYQNNIELLYL